MAQHDYVIDNSTGANVRADINSALQAIVTNNSGSSAPSATFPFMLFADSAAGTMKIRNAADNAFIELFQLDGTFTLEDGSESTPALAFRDDLNTGIFSSAADKFNIATGGTERLELGTTTIFNEDGADVDFRIEGDTNQNLFYVDAGNDRIGIGTSSPEQLLHVQGTNNGDILSLLRLTNAGGSANTEARIEFELGTFFTGYIGQTHDSGDAGSLVFGNKSSAGAAPTEKMRINKSGNMAIGITSPAARLHIYGDGHYVTTDSGKATNGIHVRGSQGNSGEFGGAISFSCGDANSSSAIAAVQNSNDSDVTGLSFFTHSSSDGSADAEERMRIDSSGHLLVNTSSVGGGSYDQLSVAGGIKITDDSNSKLEIGRFNSSSATNSYIKIGSNSDSLRISNAADSVDLFTLTNSGNVGIGTTSPTCGLHIDNPSDGAITQILDTDNSAVKLVFRNSTETGNNMQIGADGSNLVALTGATQRMRLLSDGDIFLGGANTADVTGNSSSAGFVYDSDGGAGNHPFVCCQHASRSGGSASYIKFQAATTVRGTIHESNNGFDVSYGSTSDYRLKENVVTLSNAITRLKTLLPKRFNWIEDETNTLQDGFLAHEVTTAVPQAVTGTKDEVDENNKPVYQQIDQSKLVPLLVAAVQELIGKVEALEAA